jgi:hypothetical protein
MFFFQAISLSLQDSDITAELLCNQIYAPAGVPPDGD